jgi:hypothetical protein|tara:strand:- start:326 stop:595 length:270 start_codon:yes stop_codon:yes gene_type:complete
MAKTKYYFVWIEGISPRNGELLGKLTDYGYDVTNKITEALRVKENDLGAIKHYLSRHGVADWVLDNPDSFVRTNYVPGGTLLNLKKVSI